MRVLHGQEQKIYQGRVQISVYRHGRGGREQHDILLRQITREINRAFRQRHPGEIAMTTQIGLGALETGKADAGRGN